MIQRRLQQVFDGFTHGGGHIVRDSGKESHLYGVIEIAREEWFIDEEVLGHRLRQGTGHPYGVFHRYGGIDKIIIRCDNACHVIAQLSESLSRGQTAKIRGGI
jgi:hypothetical protein